MSEAQWNNEHGHIVDPGTALYPLEAITHEKIAFHFGAACSHFCLKGPPWHIEDTCGKIVVVERRNVNVFYEKKKVVGPRLDQDLAARVRWVAHTIATSRHAYKDPLADRESRRADRIHYLKTYVVDGTPEHFCVVVQNEDDERRILITTFSIPWNRLVRVRKSRNVLL